MWRDDGSALIVLGIELQCQVCSINFMRFQGLALGEQQVLTSGTFYIPEMPYFSLSEGRSRSFQM